MGRQCEGREIRRERPRSSAEDSGLADRHPQHRLFTVVFAIEPLRIVRMTSLTGIPLTTTPLTLRVGNCTRRPEAGLRFPFLTGRKERYTYKPTRNRTAHALRGTAETSPTSVLHLRIS